MNASNVAVLIIGVAIAGLVGFQVVGAVTSEEAVTSYEQAEQWCNDHNGELYNAQVVGSHGGLHCTLPNGTSVHMHEVAL